MDPKDNLVVECEDMDKGTEKAVALGSSFKVNIQADTVRITSNVAVLALKITIIIDIQNYQYGLLNKANEENVFIRRGNTAISQSILIEVCCKILHGCTACDV